MRSARGAVAGVVLAGGASRRMGRDKALIEIDSRPMVQIAADALSGVGLDPIVVIGGERSALGALGLTLVADRHPGEGPLGALLTAFGHCSTDWVIALACDLPGVSAAALEPLVAAVHHADRSVVLGHDGESPQYLCGAYHRRVFDRLDHRFAQGERSIARALEPSWIQEVPLAASAVIDVDDERDLARWEADRRLGGGDAAPPAR